MNRRRIYFAMGAPLAVAMLPVAALYLFTSGPHPFAVHLLALLHLAGWFLITTVVLWWLPTSERLARMANEAGVPAGVRSFSDLLAAITDSVQRKNQALDVNFLEQRITSKEQLSRALERVV